MSTVVPQAESTTTPAVVLTGDPALGPNLALGKTATQSSTHEGREASRAVDGNTDGNYAKNTSACTTSQAQPWWQVDLGSVFAISAIALSNRSDTAADRLSNFFVRVSEDGSVWHSYHYEKTAPARLVLEVNRPARYVKVQLSGVNYLTLAEVQVFGEQKKAPPAEVVPAVVLTGPENFGPNLALGKPATQIDSYDGAVASRAVDGKTDGNWKNNTVTHTNSTDQPWWQVDLESVYTVSAIVLHNRTDAVPERLSNFYVRLSEDGISWFSYHHQGTAPARLPLVVNRRARFVKVQLAGKNCLSLAEVQVFGEPPPVAPPIEEGAANKKVIAALEQKIADQNAKIEALEKALGKCADCDETLGKHKSRIEALEAAAKKCAECESQQQQQTAALESLREKVGGHDSDIALLQAKVKDLQDEVAACKGCKENDQIQGRKIADLEARLAKLEEKLTSPDPEQSISDPEPPKKEVIVVPPTWPTPATPAQVVVSYIHFVGSVKGTQSDEYLEIKNTGGTAQNIAGWRVNAGSFGQTFTFPASTLLQPGATIRVYTNQAPTAPNHFSFASKRALWNDGGDLGQLFDAAGVLVSQYGYLSRESRSVESIKATYGVEKMQLVFDQGQLDLQSRYPCKIDFLTALERTLRNLLDDPADSDRPNAANQVRDNYEGVPSGADATLIQAFIRKHLNEHKLILIHDEYLPDFLQNVKDNWVFRLKDGMGDLHWVIIDRSGTKPAYQEIT